MTVKPSHEPQKTAITESNAGVEAQSDAVSVLPFPTTEYQRPRRKENPDVGAAPNDANGFDSTVEPVKLLVVELGMARALAAVQLSLSGVLVAFTSILM